MLYIFRIEANLLDATVFVTKDKRKAEKILKRNYLRKCDLVGKDCVKKMNCATYEELTGNKKDFPTPYEIVEYGIVKRYKIEH